MADRTIVCPVYTRPILGDPGSGTAQCVCGTLFYWSQHSSSPESPAPTPEPAASPDCALPKPAAGFLSYVLVELRQLEKEATPGPWKQYHDDILIGQSPHDEVLVQCYGGLCDSALIVAIRNALPGLLDELERLQRHLDITRERDLDHPTRRQRA